MEKQNKYPKISIVTPSYNQAKFLEDTILSIGGQTYPQFEYIIIDGGSTDGSAEIIKKYQDKISYWASETDQGQSDAINKGFLKATGDLLCWVNADDILFPYALEKVAKVYKENPDADIITGNIVRINNDDRVVRCIKVPEMRWRFCKYGMVYFTSPPVFFKKELYEQVGGVDNSLHISMDLDLWHKFRIRGAKVCHIEEYLGAFRIHPLSKTEIFRSKNRKIFEHRETTLIRSRYIPSVPKRIIRLFQIFYKLWQIFNLNYIRSWIDLQKWKKMKWQQIFDLERVSECDEKS